MNRLFAVAGTLLVSFALFIVLALQGSGLAQAGPKELRLAIDTEPQTLDPISIADTISDGVAQKVYNKLLRFEKQPNGEIAVKPDLAESFEVSKDGRIYTFKMRRGVRFHNGREVKAEDAVYSLTRLLSPKSKRSELMAPFVKGSEEYLKDPKAPLGITAPDEYTVRIELNEPFAPFTQHLSTVSCAVVAKEAAESGDKIFSRSPVGTGPFKLERWENFQYLLFRRNDDYFRGKPKLDSIRFTILKDRTLQLNRYLAGLLDACSIPAGKVKKAIQMAGPKNVWSTTSLRTNYIGISMPNGKYAGQANLSPYGTNKLLRQAMNYSIDRDYLIEVLEGRGVPACGILPPGILAFKPGRPGWPKDLKKARELVAQAGYPDGKGLPPITMVLRNDEDAKRLGQAIAHDWEQIGIRVELKAIEWNTFLNIVENEPQPMFMLGWVADYPDPDNFLYVLFNSKQFGSPGNQTWYSNPEVDALTEKARKLTDIGERAKIYQRVEDIILDEAPWICTYHPSNEILLRKEVKGIRENMTALDTGTEFPNVDFGFVDIEE